MNSSPPPTASEPGYYDLLKKANVAPLWRIPGTTDPEPSVPEVPYVWHWADLEPLLHQATEVMELGVDEADRRALNAHNPTRAFGTTHTLVAGYQLVLPGETAPAHRHSPGAIRFMLAGTGYTTVEGEPVLMEPGDLVLTPAETWHDHRHPGAEPMVWLDGLDVPFVKQMRANFYEDHPSGGLQPLHRPDGYSTARYGAGFTPVADRPARPHSPIMNYTWGAALAALDALAAEGPDPHDGVRIEYTNPLTGGHVLPTMACYLARLPEPTAPQRHVSSSVFCVARGSGHSIVGGRRLEWSHRDFFAVPAWTWYEHVPDPGTDTILFEMSDIALLEPFGLERKEKRT
ncbi:cupin domain-containing protein [Streptomyces sp. NPDC097640]|uniref:cupin domain-containing protein n=1 Tax=Streptomyces sp. NPDC097640 TaxID=3157229 RepID=UPI0033287A18